MDSRFHGNDRPTDFRDKKLAKLGCTLHHYRNEQRSQKQWGITKLYNAYFHEPASQLYKLHKQLDAIVLQAHGFSPDDDLLEKHICEATPEEYRPQPRASRKRKTR